MATLDKHARLTPAEQQRLKLFDAEQRRAQLNEQGTAPTPQEAAITKRDGTQKPPPDGK